jgi:ferric-dicitrate binding protein FerR (iron transport regulator)
VAQKTLIRRVSPIKKLIPFIKYAAVIIFSVGLTWFAKDFYIYSKHEPLANSLSEAHSEISVSYGSKSKLILPDGSLVYLNSGSTIRYPARFDHSTRNVYLDGEAFFDVKKDPLNPFYVETRDITIKVLGTKFNIKSYCDENTIETTLVTGSIELFSNRNIISNKKPLIVLKPKQQAIFEKQTGEISISDQTENPGKTTIKPVRSLLVQSKIDVNPVIAWKDNRLIFREENFADLSRKLERWYDVEIKIQDEELARASFSGVFVNETIEQALNALKIATPFQYQMNKNNIIILKQPQCKN